MHDGVSENGSNKMPPYGQKENKTVSMLLFSKAFLAQIQKNKQNRKFCNNEVTNALNSYTTAISVVETRKTAQGVK